MNFSAIFGRFSPLETGLAARAIVCYIPAPWQPPIRSLSETKGLPQQMCRAPKWLAIGLATVFLCSLSATEAPAQQAGSSKKSVVRPVQASGKDLEAPAPKAKAAGGSPPAVPPTKKVPARQPAADVQAESPAEDEKLERPQGGLDFRVEKLAPELEQLLQDWERESAKFQRLAGTFSRRRYDNVFGVEFWAEGKFVYEAPDKGNYELNGVPPNPKVEPKTDSEGNPYRRDPDDSEKWVCSGTHVFKVNDKAKTYEAVEIPAAQRGQNIIDGPLPFLFGMKAEQAKLRYRLQLLPPAKKIPKFANDFHIKVIPRRPEDLASWVEARILLNPKNYLPHAVTLTHPGNSETVHIFHDGIEINNVNKFKEFLMGDPFKPKVSGYKLVLNEAGPRAGEAPANLKSAAPKTGAGEKRDVPRTSDAGAADRQKAPTKRK